MQIRNHRLGQNKKNPSEEGAYNFKLRISLKKIQSAEGWNVASGTSWLFQHQQVEGVGDDLLGCVEALAELHHRQRGEGDVVVVVDAEGHKVVVDIEDITDADTKRVGRLNTRERDVHRCTRSDTECNPSTVVT